MYFNQDRPFHIRGSVSLCVTNCHRNCGFISSKCLFHLITHSLSAFLGNSRENIFPSTYYTHYWVIAMFYHFISMFNSTIADKLTYFISNCLNICQIFEIISNSIVKAATKSVRLHQPKVISISHLSRSLLYYPFYWEVCFIWYSLWLFFFLVQQIVRLRSIVLGQRCLQISQVASYMPTELQLLF